MAGALVAALAISMSSRAWDFRDVQQSPHVRACELVAHMSLPEKIAELTNRSAAIPRLGIPSYDYWTEALHGTVAPLPSTVFPQAIGLAASWNPKLLKQVAGAISDEARAAFQTTAGRGSGQGMGLTLFAPNINIDRDPRWGRGQETYGEDPYLTSRLAVAYIRGLQGDNPNYLKTIATAKHFAAYNGPEAGRYSFDARVSPYDLGDTYFPAFRAAVDEGHAQSIMCSYSAINGVPSCANSWLLQNVLRESWGFQGYVISDQYAVSTMYWKMGYATSESDATARALAAGTDISLGPENWLLAWNYWKHEVSARQIDRALNRLFTARIKLGLFDPPERVPYSQLGVDVIDSPEHRALARQTARQSIVLLKNDGVLPLNPKVHNLTVTGPFANSASELLGNYNGRPSYSVTPYQALQERLHDVQWASAAHPGTVTIVCLGLSKLDEDEHHDRERIEMPADQVSLLRTLRARGAKVVVLLFGGAGVSFPTDLADAILQVWYPGEEGGHAIADVLFGDYNPSGRLPITIYRSTSDLPSLDDYHMRDGHTYRYHKGSVLFPFGFGLSYSRFAYSGLHLAESQISPGQDLNLSFTVTNSGAREGAEVYEIYLSGPRGHQPRPILALKSFGRIHLAPGTSQTLNVHLGQEQLASTLEDGSHQVLPGHYQIWVGGQQPSHQNSGQVLSAEFEVLPTATQTVSRL